MPTSRHLKRITWLVGLVLVLASLGHDALMASAAHARPILEAAPTAHGSGFVDVNGGHHAPEHPETCHAVGEAASFPGNPLAAHDPGEAVNIVDADPSVVAVRSVDAWTEPLWPPGTRRAFFQVYRI